VYSPDSLRSLQLKLASMSVAEIMSGFRVDTFNDRNIYPGGWTKDMASYVAQQLERFLRKLRELVDSKLGMMVIIL
jgi:NADH:ubiquinone oxidoreductase subunit D